MSTTSSSNPHTYRRRVLLAVTGLSPQVVTETVYALGVMRRHPPTEVRVVTTLEGSARIRSELLHPGSGWFHRLRSDYGLSPITFGEEQVHVLADASGKQLEDIRDIEQNTTAADAITDIVRELSEDEDCSLHVSIAGGRKTMGFYLGYALSLFGRPQDRLSHVLVTPPYESNPAFFYPSISSELIYDRNGCAHDKRDARVTLAEIPFVRLRDGLRPRLLDGRSAFSSVVADAQRAVPPVRLVLRPASCTVEAGGESLRMRPLHFAFYWMLAERARAGEAGISWFQDHPPGSRAVATELLSYYARVVGVSSADYVNTESALRDGLKQPTFNPLKSQVRGVFQKNLGRRAEPYLVRELGRLAPNKPYKLFGLALTREAIEIVA